ncbi:MAG: hypothetical protein WEB00_03770 [Dehalococcoidia bacterium]
MTFRALLLALPLALAGALFTAFGGEEPDPFCDPATVATGDETTCAFSFQNESEGQVFAFVEGYFGPTVSVSSYPEADENSACAAVEADEVPPAPDEPPAPDPEETVTAEEPPGEITIDPDGDGDDGRSEEDLTELETVIAEAEADGWQPGFICGLFIDAQAEDELSFDFAIAEECDGTLFVVSLVSLTLTPEELDEALAPYAGADWMPVDDAGAPDVLALIAAYAAGDLPDEADELFADLIPDDVTVVDEDVDSEDGGSSEDGNPGDDGEVGPDGEPPDDGQGQTEVWVGVDTLTVVVAEVEVESDQTECYVILAEDDSAEESASDTGCMTVSAEGLAPCRFEFDLQQDGGNSADFLESLKNELLSDTGALNQTPTLDPTAAAGDTSTTTTDTTGGTTDDTASVFGSGTTTDTTSNGTTFGTTAERSSPNVSTGDGSYAPGTAGWWLLMVLFVLSIAVVAAPIVFWSNRTQAEEVRINDD